MPKQELPWTCKLCNVTPPVGDELIHLSSGSHAKSLFDRSIPREPPRARGPKGTVSKGTQKSRQSGNKRREKPRAEGQVKDTMVTKPQTAAVDSYMPKPAPPKATPIDNVSPAQKPMVIRLKSAVAPQKPPQAKKSTKIGQKPTESHEKPGLDLEKEKLVKVCLQTKPEWWSCPTCKITMYASAQESHQNGKCKGHSTVVKFEPSAIKDPLVERILAKKKPTAVSNGAQKRYDAQLRTREQKRDRRVNHGREAKSSKLVGESDDE